MALELTPSFQYERGSYRSGPKNRFAGNWMFNDIEFEEAQDLMGSTAWDACPSQDMHTDSW